MAIKIKKTKKSQKLRGTTTHGHGARKKWKKSGHKGGIGMAGTGKRADHKKTLINKLYGNKYFGKQGITSKGTVRKKLRAVNIGDIQRNIDNLKKKYEKDGVLDLKDYKVLGEGELSIKLIIKARAFSDSAKEKIEKAGGKCIEPERKVRVVKEVKGNGKGKADEGDSEKEVKGDKKKEKVVKGKK